MALNKNRRSLNTSYYNDPYIEDLGRNEHEVFLTLLLNPLNNLAGVYEISVKKLASFAKMEPDEVRIAINNLMDDGKILYINSWVAIKNHIKNQSINPKMSKNILEILKQVPMQMKVFVLLDNQGELEKWSQQLFDKLEDHYNNKKKRELSKTNIDYNPQIHGIQYSKEQFLIDINGVENSNNSNMKALDTLSNPSINKKEEIGRKKKEKGNKKEEIEVLPETPLAEAEPLNDKTLKKTIEDIFLSKNNDNFDNWAKERKAIKGIIEKAGNRENTDSFIQGLIEKFYDLTINGNTFWIEQPFLPSILNSNGIFPRVEKQIQIEEEPEDLTAYKWEDF